MSAGTNGMIRRGEAKLVTGLSDILEEFGEGGFGEEAQQVAFSDLSPLEQRIVKATPPCGGSAPWEPCACSSNGCWGR